VTTNGSSRAHDNKFTALASLHHQSHRPQVKTFFFKNKICNWPYRTSKVSVVGVRSISISNDMQQCPDEQNKSSAILMAYALGTSLTLHFSEHTNIY
jgi:hypothetical protein